MSINIKDGDKIIATDFSEIEARVLAKLNEANWKVGMEVIESNMQGLELISRVEKITPTGRVKTSSGRVFYPDGREYTSNSFGTRRIAVPNEQVVKRIVQTGYIKRTLARLRGYKLEDRLDYDKAVRLNNFLDELEV